MYTVLFANDSFFISSETRDQLLLARSSGVNEIVISLAGNGCSCQKRVAVNPGDVVAFIAHAEIGNRPEPSNVIPIASRVAAR
jgi:hypothetical protein